MKENVLEVLLYLFENYMIEDSQFQPDQEALSIELSQAGFEQSEISKAFSWLEDLSTLCEQPSDGLAGGSAESMRHFSTQELAKMDPAARALLLSLEQAGVLDPTARELVIDRFIALEVEDADLDHLKWVIMMVLCNRADCESALNWAEGLVLDGVQPHLH